ncbi:MAG: hypothetical protein AB3N17_17955 [Tateyamaria sp.]
MTEFVASVSWFGWLGIALAITTVWQLPTIIRNWRNRPADVPKVQAGEDPPTHDSGW